MQQARLQIEKAVQKFQLKMKGELDIINKKQITVRKDVKMSIKGFADWLIASENKIDFLEKSRATSRSKLEITEGFANYLVIFGHDVSQFMKTHNEIGIEADLRFKEVTDRLGRVKALIATMPTNTQIPNSEIRPQKAKGQNDQFVLPFTLQ